MEVINKQIESLRNDYSLLPLLLDILSTAEKHSKDQLSKKVVEFKAKIQACKKGLEDIKGLECSLEGQEKLYQGYVNELKNKRKALEKFQYLDVIAKSQEKETR